MASGAPWSFQNASARPAPIRSGPRGLFPGQFLWKDGQITALLDFESESHEGYAFDLLVTVLAWCGSTDLSSCLARALVNGYVGIRLLNDAEADDVYEECSFVALRFSITRSSDHAMRPRGTGK